MNEVKTPKKPLIFYYVMVFLLLMMLNFMAIPWMAERQVREVDYGTFMTMTEDKKIAKVEIDESEIVFTDKDGNPGFVIGEHPLARKSSMIRI